MGIVSEGAFALRGNLVFKSQAKGIQDLFDPFSSSMKVMIRI